MVVGLRAAGVPGDDAPGPVGVEAVGVGAFVDLGGPLREEGEDLVGDASQAPVAELARRPRVGLDGVAQRHRTFGGGVAPDHGGGVHQVSEPAGVECLPAASGVEHLGEVGDEDVVVRLRVGGPGGQVTGPSPEQTGRRRAGSGATPTATVATEPLIEEGQGCVGLGVDDGVHVIAATHHPEHRHRLVRGHHQLHTRPPSPHHPLAQVRVDRPAGTEDGVVAVVIDPPFETEAPGDAAAPTQRRLAPAPVVAQRLAWMVVDGGEHRAAVVLDRVQPHHPKPRHHDLQHDQPEGVAIVFAQSRFSRRSSGLARTSGRPVTGVSGQALIGLDRR